MGQTLQRRADRCPAQAKFGRQLALAQDGPGRVSQKADTLAQQGEQCIRFQPLLHFFLDSAPTHVHTLTVFWRIID